MAIGCAKPLNEHDINTSHKGMAEHALLVLHETNRLTDKRHIIFAEQFGDERYETPRHIRKRRRGTSAAVACRFFQPDAKQACVTDPMIDLAVELRRPAVALRWLPPPITAILLPFATQANHARLTGRRDGMSGHARPAYDAAQRQTKSLDRGSGPGASLLFLRAIGSFRSDTNGHEG